MVLVGGFIIGFAAAGGVLLLCVSTANEMFPTAKGKITSIVMIASSIANYVVLNASGYLTRLGGDAKGPIYVIMLNIVITAIGVALAIFVNREYSKKGIA